MKFKGWKTKTRMKKEIKTSIYANTNNLDVAQVVNIGLFPFGVPANAPTVIWRNNGTDASANRYYPVIPNGAGANEAIGQKYILKYVEVIFTIEWAVNNILEDGYRICLVKSRYPTAAMNFTVGNLFLIDSVYNAPIDTKSWDVQYDRIVWRHGALQGAAVTAQGQAIPQNYKFVIPMKKSMDVGLDNVTMFDTDLIIFAYGLKNNNSFRATNITAFYRFVDP